MKARANIVAGWRPAVHPRGKKRTHTVLVIYRYKDGKVRVAKWHVWNRGQYVAPGVQSQVRVISDWVNVIGNYWQFNFETQQEAIDFLAIYAQNYN